MSDIDSDSDDRREAGTGYRGPSRPSTLKVFKGLSEADRTEALNRANAFADRHLNSVPRDTNHVIFSHWVEEEATKIKQEREFVVAQQGSSEGLLWTEKPSTSVSGRGVGPR